jgi:hypothetical protein
MKHPLRDRDWLPGRKRHHYGNSTPPGPISGSVERPRRSPGNRLSSLYGDESAWSERIVAWSQTHPELSEPPEAVEE